jgi:hypothetical protein
LFIATPAPAVSSVDALGKDVKELLQRERNYRIDAEASRQEALAALAMHNKSLETAQR